VQPSPGAEVPGVFHHNIKIMNSILTKTKRYINSKGKCIAQVVAVAEDKGFRIYVAWEWQDPASKGFFGIVKSNETYFEISKAAVEETASSGWDVSNTPEARRIFSNIL